MRPDPKLPPGAGRWPAVAAIAFMALLTGSIWWQSRAETASPVAANPVPAATAAAKPVEKAAAKPLEQVVALAQFAQRELPEDSPAARASAADGMRVLAQAIGARGDSILWRDRAQRLTEAADKVADAASSEEAAHLAHDALVQAAQWIAGLGSAPANPGSPDAVLTAAESIKQDEPLRGQSERLELFFDAAARALGGTST